MSVIRIKKFKKIVFGYIEINLSNLKLIELKINQVIDSIFSTFTNLTTQIISPTLIIPKMVMSVRTPVTHDFDIVE